MVYESSLVLQVLFTFLGMVVELIRSLLQRWKVCPVLGCPGETDKYKNGTRGCLGFLKW